MSNNMDVLRDEECEDLINLISQRPALFDCKHSAYKDQQLKENIWREIARELNKNSDACKKHWKTIRDGYVRFKRKNKLPTGSAAPQKSRTKWKTYRLLSFWDTVAQERSGISNVEDSPIDNDESTQDTIIETVESEMDNTQQPNAAINFPQSERENETAQPCTVTPRQQKRRRLPKGQDEMLAYFRERDESRQSFLKAAISKNYEDEFSSFAAHIKDVLKKLPPLLQIKAKQEIFQVLLKYEIMTVDTHLPNTSHTTLSSTPTPSIATNATSTRSSSNYRDFYIYSPVSNYSEPTDMTSLQTDEGISLVQVDNFINNDPSYSHANNVTE